jgi:hypothetical protein
VVHVFLPYLVHLCRRLYKVHLHIGYPNSIMLRFVLGET